ncbi:all-trans retinoic acid-induced differentiation factor [Suncus etruscus]|uniref:all-trans retinoic acid-induced differentiation factor n=1 Tax=Suncus etruscus TaxID=109475 RepID=UPI00210FFEB3|nr:all-trans retinoic acid-induced differentiation factor [Suncus etruscus]
MARPRPAAVLLLVALCAGRALALPEICQECPGSVQNFTEVARYCKRLPVFTLHARCCLNENDTIVGLDLQNCSLKDPGPNFHQAFSAVVIDLQANPLKDNLTDTFHGFLRLQLLVLPRDVQCPGGVKAWDNITDDKDSRTCLGQRNLCDDTRDPEMCPENGSCAPNGPGFMQCVCAEGFHGYKCMRQDFFPLLMFFGILGSATFAISLLLWGTQRRKAKAS